MVRKGLVQKRRFFGIPRSKGGTRLYVPSPTTGVATFTAVPTHNSPEQFSTLWKGIRKTQNNKNSSNRVQ